MRRFAATPGPLFVASSFSKSFSLYGERVGALSVVTATSDEAARVLSQLKRVVRANYSNPPTHGGQIVATVLSNPGAARAVGSRARRHARAHQADAQDAGREARRARARPRISASCSSSAACSRTPVSTNAQVARLREDYSVYAIDTGRICVAALNSRNIELRRDAIASVISRAPSDAKTVGAF